MAEAADRRGLSGSGDVSSSRSPGGATSLRLLRSALWLLLLPGTLAGALPVLVARRAPAAAHWPSALRVAGALLGGVGVLALLWCFREFATRGRGTPAPVDPPRRLVARGLYRHVRNPMYVSVVMIVLGEALFLAVPLLIPYALSLAIGFALWVRRVEEPALRRRFGAAYDAYRTDVPRWVPRIGRASPADDEPHDRSGRR